MLLQMVGSDAQRSGTCRLARKVMAPFFNDESNVMVAREIDRGLDVCISGSVEHVNGDPPSVQD